MIWLASFATIATLIAVWRFVIRNHRRTGREFGRELVRLFGGCCCGQKNCETGCRGGCKAAGRGGARRKVGQT